MGLVKTMRLLLLVLCGIAFLSSLSPAVAGMERTGPIERVAAIPVRPEWNQFRVLVWQFKTSVLDDIELYRQVGLKGFHIDRGYGRDALVQFSLRGGALLCGSCCGQGPAVSEG